jgi:hypothetical protein
MNLGLLVKYARFGFGHVESIVRTDLSILTGRNISKPRQVYYSQAFDRVRGKTLKC